MTADGNTILHLISSALQILLLISLYVHFRLVDFFFPVTPYFPMVFVIKSLQSRLKLIWALVLPLSSIIIACYIHGFLKYFMHCHSSAATPFSFLFFGGGGNKGRRVFHLHPAHQVRLENSNLEHRSYRCFCGTGFLAFLHEVNYSSNYITALAKILLLALKQMVCWHPLQISHQKKKKKIKRSSVIWVRMRVQAKASWKILHLNSDRSLHYPLLSAQ